MAGQDEGKVIGKEITDSSLTLRMTKRGAQNDRKEVLRMTGK